jgi:hypothetical protein
VCDTRDAADHARTAPPAANPEINRCGSPPTASVGLIAAQLAFDDGPVVRVIRVDRIGVNSHMRQCRPRAFLAQQLVGVLYTEGFNDFVTSIAAPIATGWSDSFQVGFAPTEPNDIAFSRRTELRAGCFAGSWSTCDHP